MDKEKILEWLFSAPSFRLVSALKQRWERSSYSYLTVPRPNFGLILVLSGNVDFATEGGAVSARAGNLVFLPKFSHYEAIFPDVTEDYLLSFDTDTVGLSVSEPVVLVDSASVFCVEKFKSLVEKSLFGTGDGLEGRGLMYLLFNSIVTEAREQGDFQSGTLKRASELLQSDYSLSVDAVARECAVSPSTLRNIFKSKLSTSPAEYRTAMKLRQAEYLLQSTSLTVSEISERLSFFDAAYFCKVFKEHLGVTPGQYAKNKKL